MEASPQTTSDYAGMAMAGLLRSNTGVACSCSPIFARPHAQKVVFQRVLVSSRRPIRTGGSRVCIVRAESQPNTPDDRALVSSSAEPVRRVSTSLFFPEFGVTGVVPQAPVEVKTAVGRMLDYYLKMEPHLLSAAIERQLEQLKTEREENERRAQSSPAPSPENKSELVLYKYA